MTKIITTVGPISSNNNQKFLIKNSGMIRFNMSHNSPKWHKKNIDIIKKLDPKKNILVDIPGAKPRTLNKEIIKVSNGEKITFFYKKKKKNLNSIEISNPLPKLKKKKN